MITWKKTKNSKTPSSSLKYPVAPCGPLWFCGSLAVYGSVAFYGRGFVWGRSKHKVARTQTILADWRQTDKLPIIGDCKAGKASGPIFSLQLESVIHRMPKFSNWAWRRNHSMKIYSGDGPVVKLERRIHLDSSSLKDSSGIFMLLHDHCTAQSHWIPHHFSWVTFKVYAHCTHRCC